MFCQCNVLHWPGFVFVKCTMSSDACVECLMGWLVDCLIHWLIDWLIDLLVGSLITVCVCGFLFDVCFVSRLQCFCLVVGWLAGWLATVFFVGC